MNKKVIISILLIVVVIGLCVSFATITQPKKKNNTITNNTNNTTNTTNSTLNNTQTDNTTEQTSSQSQKNSNSNSYSNQKQESDPEYGSDEYVKKWDDSQRGDAHWAYTHKQPVKYEDGHQYSRVYNPDSGESRWDKVT